MAEENKKSALKSAFKQPGEQKMKKNVSVSLDIEESDQNASAAQASINVPEVSQQTKNKKSGLNIDIEIIKESSQDDSSNTAENKPT